MKKGLRKLQLNRETLRRLDQGLAWVVGGTGDTADTCGDDCAAGATATCTCVGSGCPEICGSVRHCAPDAPEREPAAGE